MKTKFKLFEGFKPPSGSFVVTVTKEDYNKETKTFSFEISQPSKKIKTIPPAIVYIQSAKTGKYLKMFRFKIDTDATEEDIYGWWYKDEYDNYKLLIIND